LLIWLASYPRSGNTFVRIVLNEVFGIKSMSLHGDADERVFSPKPGVVEAIGHLASDLQGDELINWARRSTETYVIKTHEPPATNDPAIYVVRDGRSALVSYFHYLNKVESFPITYQDVIDGNVYGGSWSEHFYAWHPLSRSRTLLLRYEDVTKDRDHLEHQLGDFFSMKPGPGSRRSFAELHSLYPDFFRRGDDSANIQELQPYLDRVLARHGSLLRVLGYI
jgi:hypothetical protein